MTTVKLKSQPWREEIEAFFTLLYRDTRPNAIGRGVIYGNDVKDAALIDVSSWSMGIHIHEIRALTLRQGSGTRALKLLCWCADETGVTLTLNAKRIGKLGMTSAQLRVWYRKYGFVAGVQTPTFMQRSPQPVKALAQ